MYPIMFSIARRSISSFLTLNGSTRNFLKDSVLYVSDQPLLDKEVNIQYLKADNVIDMKYTVHEIHRLKHEKVKIDGYICYDGPCLSNVVYNTLTLNKPKKYYREVTIIPDPDNIKIVRAK